VIAGLRDLDKTVFLTTHYMEEAQALAERVAILARGEIVAQGTPGEIGGRDRAAARIVFSLPAGVAASELPVEVTGDAGGPLTVGTDDPVPILHKLTGWALERGVELEELEVRRPSLEDVYIALTAEPGADRDGAGAAGPDQAAAAGPAGGVEGAGGDAPADREASG
jgi:ABC-2 type transport system ATP-binding protein